MNAAYPITLDVTTRLIVIIGGGKVATRKVKGLLDAGATQIRVVSPRFDPIMSPNVTRITETYAPHHLTGAALVFAATNDPDVNAQVAGDGHAQGLWVNRADTDEESDFATPAAHRIDEILLTVSAGGSPALAAALRNELSTYVAPKWIAMAAAMQHLRPRIKASGATVEARRLAFRELATPAAIDFLQQHDPETLWNWLIQKHPAIAR